MPQEIIYQKLTEIGYGVLNCEILRVCSRSPEIFDSNYSSNNNHHERIEKDRKYYQEILDEINKRRTQ